MKYTAEQLNSKFESLPKELQDAITSEETLNKIEGIGKKHSLMLDKVSELADETGLIMIGLTKSNEFVKNLCDRMEIDPAKATEIAKDINTEILDSIRVSLRKIQEEAESVTENENSVTPNPITPSTPPAPPALPTPDPMIKQTITAIEKAGDFTIETHIDPHGAAHVQDHIPMMDHLLTTPVSQHIQTEVRKVEEKRSYTSDPYREEV